MAKLIFLKIVIFSNTIISLEVAFFSSFNQTATRRAYSSPGTFIIKTVTAWNYFPFITQHTNRCSNTVYICHQKLLWLLFSLLSHVSLKKLKGSKVGKQRRNSERLQIQYHWFWHSPEANYRNKMHTKIQFIPLCYCWARHFWKMN